MSLRGRRKPQQAADGQVFVEQRPVYSVAARRQLCLAGQKERATVRRHCRRFRPALGASASPNALRWPSSSRAPASPALWPTLGASASPNALRWPDKKNRPQPCVARRGLFDFIPGINVHRQAGASDELLAPVLRLSRSLDEFWGRRLRRGPFTRQASWSTLRSWASSEHPTFAERQPGKNNRPQPCVARRGLFDFIPGDNEHRQAGALGQLWAHRFRRTPFVGRALAETKKNPPGRTCRGGLFLFPALTYSLTSRQYHRRGGLNGRVRNGNGCFPYTMDTGKYN